MYVKIITLISICKIYMNYLRKFTSVVKAWNANFPKSYHASADKLFGKFNAIFLLVCYVHTVSCGRHIDSRNYIEKCDTVILYCVLASIG